MTESRTNWICCISFEVQSKNSLAGSTLKLPGIKASLPDRYQCAVWRLHTCAHKVLFKAYQILFTLCMFVTRSDISTIGGAVIQNFCHHQRSFFFSWLIIKPTEAHQQTFSDESQSLRDILNWCTTETVACFCFYPAVFILYFLLSVTHLHCFNSNGLKLHQFPGLLLFSCVTALLFPLCTVCYCNFCDMLLAYFVLFAHI